MADGSAESRLRALVPPPDGYVADAPDAARLTHKLGAQPPPDLLGFLGSWGSLRIVPTYAAGEPADGGLPPMLVVHDRDSLDVYDPSDDEELTFDLTRIAPRGDGELRAVAFAWLGAVPSDGQLWWWWDGDRSGVAYVDDASVVHPVEGDVFDAVLRRFAGEPPFDAEIQEWHGHVELQVVPHDDAPE